MAKWGEIKCPRCAELEAQITAMQAKMDEVFAREIQRVKQIIETHKPPHNVPLFIVAEEYELMWSEITEGKE